MRNLHKSFKPFLTKTQEKKITPTYSEYKILDVSALTRQTTAIPDQIWGRKH